ncbi:septation regulator SpoVG [Guggenheimella bovis]
MEITGVSLRKIDNDSKLVAVASVTFDGSFVVHGIKIIENESGLMVAMPSRKAADGKYIDVAHPINSEMRTYIAESVLRDYSNRLQAE